MIKIGDDGLCECTCAGDCPLGRTGMAMRCSREELHKAGVLTAYAKKEPKASASGDIRFLLWVLLSMALVATIVCAVNGIVKMNELAAGYKELREKVEDALQRIDRAKGTLP